MQQNESLTHSIKALKKACRAFNRLEHDADEVLRRLRIENIKLKFWLLRPELNGFYGVNRRYRPERRYIVLNRDLLAGERWVTVACHELVHHFLDAPASTQEVYWSRRHKRRSREEVRADKLALIFRYPKRLVLELMGTPFDQLAGYDVEELKKRMRILEEVGE